MKRREFIFGMSLGGMSLVSSFGAQTVDATPLSVLRDIPIAEVICQRIISITTSVLSPDTNAQNQITTFAGDLIASLETIKTTLVQSRGDFSRISPASVAAFDSAFSRYAQELRSILGPMPLYPAGVQKGVGIAVNTLQILVLGIAALVPPAQADQYPLTMAVMMNNGYVLGNIKIGRAHV